MTDDKVGGRGMRKVRNQRGAALLLGITVAALFLVFAVPVIVFSANLSCYLVARSQAKHIAIEAARVIDQSKYWLELPRPDYSTREQAQAIDNANTAVELMTKEMGFKTPKATFSFRTGSSANIDETVCKLDVAIGDKIPFRTPIFNIDPSSFYPPRLSMEGTVEHRTDIGPYAVMHMDCPVEPLNQPNAFVFGPGEGPPQNRGVAVLPAFGFWHHVPPDHGQLSPYGRLGGFQGTADITEVQQFAAFNWAGFTSRNDLLRVLRRTPDGKLEPRLPGPSPGSYITTGYLQPSSYHN